DAGPSGRGEGEAPANSAPGDAGGGGEHPSIHPDRPGRFAIRVWPVGRPGGPGGEGGAPSPPSGSGGLSLPHRFADLWNRRLQVGRRKGGGFGEGGAGAL